jgi:hypothetical protein
MIWKGSRQKEEKTKAEPPRSFLLGIIKNPPPSRNGKDPTRILYH